MRRIEKEISKRASSIDRFALDPGSKGETTQMMSTCKQACMVRRYEEMYASNSASSEMRVAAYSFTAPPPAKGQVPECNNLLKAP